MKKQRHIYFFLPNFAIGGAGNSIFNISKSIKNKKDKITVISIGVNAYKTEFLKMGANVVELKKKKTIFAVLSILKLLKRDNKKYKQIFVSNINYSNVLSSIFLKKVDNLKLILIERTPFQELEIYFSFIDFLKKKTIYYLAKLYYKNADYIIGNSYSVSKYVEKKIKKKVITIYPIIKINKIKKRNNKILNLTWIGRHSSEKNLKDFLKSFKYLENENIKINILSNENIEFFIDEYSSPNFRKKIKIYNFKKSKYFLNKIYSKTDIFISTSLYEGFPNSLVDAVNNLCLIISSKSFGGYREIIKNENYGLIYKTNDHLDLVKKIKYAVNNFKNCKKKIIKAKKNLEILALKHNTEYKKFFNKI